jgi:hypothetical protein
MFLMRVPRSEANETLRSFATWRDGSLVVGNRADAALFRAVTVSGSEWTARDGATAFLQAQSGVRPGEQDGHGGVSARWLTGRVGQTVTAPRQASLFRVVSDPTKAGAVRLVELGKAADVRARKLRAVAPAAALDLGGNSLFEIIRLEDDVGPQPIVRSTPIWPLLVLAVLVVIVLGVAVAASQTWIPSPQLWNTQRLQQTTLTTPTMGDPGALPPALGPMDQSLVLDSSMNEFFA